MNRDVSK